jgi:hypothetical protein
MTSISAIAEWRGNLAVYFDGRVDRPRVRVMDGDEVVADNFESITRQWVPVRGISLAEARGKKLIVDRLTFDGSYKLIEERIIGQQEGGSGGSDGADGSDGSDQRSQSGPIDLPQVETGAIVVDGTRFHARTFEELDENGDGTIQSSETGPLRRTLRLKRALERSNVIPYQYREVVREARGETNQTDQQPDDTDAGTGGESGSGDRTESGTGSNDGSESGGSGDGSGSESSSDGVRFEWGDGSGEGSSSNGSNQGPATPSPDDDRGAISTRTLVGGAVVVALLMVVVL